ncbi:unnamed protein product [Lathyrus oleraceus]
MAKIVKFVYFIIIIFSLFFAATNVESFYPTRPCSSDKYCPPHRCPKPKISVCIKEWCRCVEALVHNIWRNTIREDPFSSLSATKV